MISFFFQNIYFFKIYFSFPIPNLQKGKLIKIKYQNVKILYHNNLKNSIFPTSKTSVINNT